MPVFASIPPHHAEVAMRHAWTTGNDEDVPALAALRFLGALPDPDLFHGACQLQLIEESGTLRPARLTGATSDVLVKEFTDADRANSFCELVFRAVAALCESEGGVRAFWDRCTSSQEDGITIVDLAACARVVSEEQLTFDYTVVGTWNRPEEIPGCADREPVDDFVERVHASTPEEAAQLAVMLQKSDHPQAAAPTCAGYGMEPRAIAVFPMRLWPAQP